MLDVSAFHMLLRTVISWTSQRSTAAPQFYWGSWLSSLRGSQREVEGAREDGSATQTWHVKRVLSGYCVRAVVAAREVRRERRG